jgi:lipid II:glycine glycyltransferase (peptidoglycan interpeptide bridge formation enzyme)
MPEVSPQEWAAFTADRPDTHLLQTGNWASLKERFGWRARYIITGDSGALVLFRGLPLGYSLGYIPKGPVGSPKMELWQDLDVVCRQEKAVLLKVEPDRWLDPQEPKPETPPPGFIISKHIIQPPRTILLDLSGDEDQILAQMKQKTRYNIRLAGRKDILVHPSTDIQTFHRLLQVTGERDQFGVHSLAYYQAAYDLFHPKGACELLLATYEGEPLAGLMVFASGPRSWYLFGASTDLHRNRMPNHLLQWEAIRWARAQGCTEYDLWGIPDASTETLEAEFTDRADGLWGVYRFKRGFGGEQRRAAGPWEKVYHSALYWAYQWWVARRISA